jgi:hypothetical protein
MSKHWTWIVVVGLLAAATAFAATAPAAPDEPSAPAAAAAAPVLACPYGHHDGEQPCNCQGDNAGQEEHQCNGDGSCGCGHFVDENGDTICDNRGQGGHCSGDQDQPQDQ